MFAKKFLWLHVYRLPGLSSIFLDERSHKQIPEISDLLLLQNQIFEYCSNVHVVSPYLNGWSSFCSLVHNDEKYPD